MGLDFYAIDFEDKIIDVPTQSLLAEEEALFDAALAAMRESGRYQAIIDSYGGVQ